MPGSLQPMTGFPRIVFLKPLAEGRPNTEIGDYSYYDDPNAPERFFDRNVLYDFDFIGDRLVIGRFVAIATGVRILMNGGTHAMTGFSTFPFDIFGQGWEAEFAQAGGPPGHKGDTVIGSDVWIGHDATILPGVTIGPGAIIAARAVVSREVPPYVTVAGNPARVVRHRFDPDTTRMLLRIAWWDWPVARITRNLDAIRGADLAALRAAR